MENSKYSMQDYFSEQVVKRELRDIEKAKIEEYEESSKSKPKKGLLGAIEKLKEESTDEEYEYLIKKMFESLDRKCKRKVIDKKLRHSAQVSKALFRRS